MHIPCLISHSLFTRVCLFLFVFYICMLVAVAIWQIRGKKKKGKEGWQNGKGERGERREREEKKKKAKQEKRDTNASPLSLFRMVSTCYIVARNCQLTLGTLQKRARVYVENTRGYEMVHRYRERMRRERERERHGKSLNATRKANTRGVCYQSPSSRPSASSSHSHLCYRLRPRPSFSLFLFFSHELLA